MIEKEFDKKQWHLVRNDNGEWISDDNVVFLTALEATVWKSMAIRQKKPLSIQHGIDGQLWCYRHEFEAIEDEKIQPANRILKIKKAMPKQETNELHCSDIYKGDNAFKRAARSKQSWFRETYLKVGFDPTNRYGKYGAFLLPQDAEDGLNFYEGFRKEIRDAIRDRYPKLNKDKHDGLYANMLRSEHIPWNVFIPMKSDLKASAKVFNTILGVPVIDKIVDIHIEWAPNKVVCLNDGTSFDTYIEFMHHGNLCGIGIEVKYTEEGYPFGKTEYREVMENDRSRYAEVTAECGLYKSEIASRPIRETDLCKDDYRQIWRNHILGESMVKNPKLEHPLEEFHTLTLYPKGNTHFKKVLPEYQSLLTEYGSSRFHSITFEEFFSLLMEYFTQNSKYRDWIRYLKIRYPF